MTFSNSPTTCGSLYTVMGDSRIINFVNDIERVVGDRGWVQTFIKRNADWTVVEVQCTLKVERPVKH